MNNPFQRGFRQLHSHPAIRISSAGSADVHRPLHTRHQHLSTLIGVGDPVVFDDEAAWLPSFDEELDQREGSAGEVREVVHEIVTTDSSGEPRHLADTATAATAADLIASMTFDTGHYSRSWEISTGHLSSESLDYLTCQGVNRGEATGMMFEVFVVPPMANHLVLGVKLIGTPWDEPGLRQEHLDAAVPADLVNVLHLAAAADVRFLVFDPDAPELEGLPYFLELSADLEEEA